MWNRFYQHVFWVLFNYCVTNSGTALVLSIELAIDHSRPQHIQRTPHGMWGAPLHPHYPPTTPYTHHNPVQEVVNALKETFHTGCFVCISCNNSIGTGQFHIEEGHVYCEKGTPNIDLCIMNFDYLDWPSFTRE